MALSQPHMETLTTALQTIHAGLGLPAHMITEATNYYSNLSGEEYELTTAKFGNTTPEKSRTFWNSFEGKVLKKEFLEEKIEKLEELRHKQDQYREYIQQQRELAIIALSLTEKRKKHQQEVIEYNESLDDKMLADEQKRLDDEIAAYGKMIESLDNQIEEIVQQIKQEQQKLDDIEQEIQNLQNEQREINNALDDVSYDLASIDLDYIEKEINTIEERIDTIQEQLANRTLEPSSEVVSELKKLKLQLEALKEQQEVLNGKGTFMDNEGHEVSDSRKAEYHTKNDYTRIVLTEGKAQSYRNTSQFIQSKGREDLISAINDGSIYFNLNEKPLTKEYQETLVAQLNDPDFMVLPELRHNFLDRNTQRIKLHTDGTHHIYDISDPNNHIDKGTPDEHACLRAQKLMTVKLKFNLTTTQSLTEQQQNKNECLERIAGLEHKRGMLVESRQICVENRAHCIAQKQNLTQKNNKQQSSFLSGLGSHKEPTQEVKKDEEPKVTLPGSRMGG